MPTVILRNGVFYGGVLYPAGHKIDVSDEFLSANSSSGVVLRILDDKLADSNRELALDASNEGLGDLDNLQNKKIQKGSRKNGKKS